MEALTLENQEIFDPKFFPSIACSKKLSDEFETEKPKSVIREEQYQTIGNTLLTCEVNDFRIGIPWLPSTKRTLQLKLPQWGGTDAFTKENLCTVNSATLEAYLHDLEAHSPSNSLCIKLNSRYEKLAFSILMGTFFVVASGYVLIATKTEVSIAMILSVFIGSFASFTALLFSSEGYRKLTFQKILLTELARRNGSDSRESRVKAFTISPSAS